MKIEKVNENQIRCTLTREDLADRELKISELAYGTEKAKNLFRDMMQQASFECGFEAEDIPLMIEAIPLNSECIVLIITKVEDPEELDTRFSKFAPSVHEAVDDSENSSDESNESIDNKDDVLNLFKKLHDNMKEKNATPVENTNSSPERFVKLFSFSDLRTLIEVANILKDSYDADNSLYKDEQHDKFLLFITQGNYEPEVFAKVCNLLSEYGEVQRTFSSSESYLEEHCSLMISKIALQSLAQV